MLLCKKKEFFINVFFQNKNILLFKIKTWAIRTNWWCWKWCWSTKLQ